ncbi:DUF3856 domain-containing protein [Rhizobium sp. SL42]|uniref:DUF3856 domain-containing protein n=1 Tax=Rhizobium sp. SL42 TaxID=2806346 RepID=UPI001F1F3D90|nr:DUF3856 domain-containing protein [Rhizobium sp. SL42]UJW77688.1 DUF3856 domain-containing protein [Rhizobium sp. SL42]
MDDEMRSITVKNILAFGNVSISGRGVKDTIAPRLDWRSPSEIVVDGEPDIFSALQWRYRLASSLYERDAELNALIQWAESSQNSISVRLLTGGGGTGKTRLAAETISQLREKGWAAGFVPRNATSSQTIETELRKFFLVFDYPEERIETVRALFQAIQDIPDSQVEFPIRILLVSRRPFIDWEDLLSDLGTRAGRQEIANLSALSADQSSKLFSEVCERFSSIIGSKQKEISHPNWKALSDAQRTPLLVMAAAINSVLSDDKHTVLDPSKLMLALANREKKRVSKVSIANGLGKEGLSRLLAMSVISSEGLTALQCEELAKLQIAEVKGQQLLDCINATPWSDQRSGRMAPVLPKLEPDRLASTFFGAVMLDRPVHRILDWLRLIAVTDSESFSSIVSKVSFDLLSVNRKWRSSFEEAVTDIVVETPNLALLFLDFAFEKGTIFSARFAVAVIDVILVIDELDNETRAVLLNNRANKKSDIGDFAAALSDAEKACEILEINATSHSKSERKNLIMMKINLARRLNENGKEDQAFDLLVSEVDKLRSYFEEAAEDDKEDLAQSIKNLSIALQEGGYPDEASAAASEAVSLFQLIWQANQTEASTQNLASALNTLSNCLSLMAGCEDEALRASIEALELLKKMPNYKSDAHEDLLAIVHSVLARRLMGLGRYAEAVHSIQEALNIYVLFHAAFPRVYASSYAEALQTKAGILQMLGRHEDALGSSLEAIKIYEELGEASSFRDIRGLGEAVASAASNYSELGRDDEALGVGRRSLEIIDNLNSRAFGRFDFDYAHALNIFAVSLGRAGKPVEAIGYLERANAILVKLENMRPGVRLGDLANVQNNLGNRYRDVGDFTLARKALEQSIIYYRDLTEMNPDAHGPFLATGLANLATLHLSAGDYLQAITFAEEAVNTLTPYFIRNPIGLADWMNSTGELYVHCCAEIGREPDFDLLAPSIEAFEKLRESDM